ncbi:hypothetical protein ACFSJU_09320 [Paradesertivirga mongoliensis]|uniref:Uncharacterized protein n=1 Tax=Paradesertivirga mongoliensis TaxID=2100740 RepID=A0ABW4ZKH7_9SPHI|nr:hypothetical protein [Pedobacter mongoliensis]
MRHCLIVTTLLYSFFLASGQEVQRKKDETLERFVERFKPEHSTVTHKVIQTNWDLKPVILAFYDQAYKLRPNSPDEQEDHRILAVLFVKSKTNHYQKIFIDTIPTEGGAPTIESFFFANADKDLKKELVIIASWNVQHYDVSGTLYQTFVYDNMSNLKDNKLRFLKYISNKLSGGCECDWQDERSRKAKFTTAASIKDELKRLGYKY